MKVYLHYGEGDDAEQHLTQKVTLPKSWVAQHTMRKVHELFLKAYNKKKGAALSLEDTHLTLEDGTVLYSDDPLSRLSNRSDLHLRPGACPARPVAPQASDASGPAAESDAGLLRCRHPGCKARFSPENNPEDACRYHLGPAIFHDRGKGWGCCRDTHRLVYDWEQFERIPGCQTGPHSDQPLANANAIAQSPTVAAAMAVQEQEDAAPLKTASDFNREHPEAVSGLTVAPVAERPRPKCTRKDDGSAKCVRKGCQLPFNIAENGPEACTYHTGEPIFWDTGKYWGCCPGQVKYDFDSFLRVPGCATGYHDDASGDFDDSESAARTVAAFSSGAATSAQQ